MDWVLTIAGSDPSGGAGVQRDLRTFFEMGITGASAITAITAQNGKRFWDMAAVSADIVGKQIDSVIEYSKPLAVKTGMLASADIVRTVCEKMQEYEIKKLVVDPVMVSTTGSRLLDEDAVDELKKLISSAMISTPNIQEAEVLSGMKIGSVEDMERAAKRLGNCVIKGGHLDAVDVLNWRGRVVRLEPEKKLNKDVHGTGCMFSAALCVSIAKGLKIPDAVKKAKKFTFDAISRSL